MQGKQAPQTTRNTGRGSPRHEQRLLQRRQRATKSHRRQHLSWPRDHAACAKTRGTRIHGRTQPNTKHTHHVQTASHHAQNACTARTRTHAEWQPHLRISGQLTPGPQSEPPARRQCRIPRRSSLRWGHPRLSSPRTSWAVSTVPPFSRPGEGARTHKATRAHNSKQYKGTHISNI